MRGFIPTLNAVIRRCWNRGMWNYFKASHQFQFPASYSTGTVLATNASGNITGTSTVWTSAMSNRKIRFANESEEYIFTYASGTTATITPSYLGTTGSGKSYVIYDYEDILTPAVLRYWIDRVLRCWDLTRQVELVPITADDMKLKDILNSTTGYPAYYSIFGVSTSGSDEGWRFMVWPAPVSATTILVQGYTRWSSAGSTDTTGLGLDGIRDTISVPDSWDELLALGVYAHFLEQWERDKGVTFQERYAGTARRQFNELLEILWSNQEPMADFAVEPMPRTDGEADFLVRTNRYDIITET